MNISNKCWNLTDQKMVKLNTKSKKFQTKFILFIWKLREFSSFRGAFSLSMLSILPIQSTEIQLLFKHEQNYIEIFLAFFVFQAAWIMICFFVIIWTFYDVFISFYWEFSWWFNRWLIFALDRKSIFVSVWILRRTLNWKNWNE